MQNLMQIQMQIQMQIEGYGCAILVVHPCAGVVFWLIGSAIWTDRSVTDIIITQTDIRQTDGRTNIILLV